MTSPAVTTADPVAIAASMLTHALEALADPPTRTYIGHGEPAAPQPTDGGCENEQLTVHLVRMRPKTLADTQGVNTRVFAVAWTLTLATVLFRCVPIEPEAGGIDPAAAELDAAYRALLAQGTDIARHFSRLHYRDEWSELEPCRDVIWGNLEPIAPSGGIAGWRLLVDVQL